MNLNLPQFNIKLAKDGENIKIFDILRKKFVAFTPEENVRQHFVNWIIDSLGYPKGLMGNEVSISLNSTHRRCDTVVFTPSGLPLMIIEYRAPTITITQNVFDQIVRYNMVLRAKFLVVSNGIEHYCCVIDYSNNTYSFLEKIPYYTELI